MSTSDSQRIIKFYDPSINGVDSHSRTLNDILAKNDTWLEQCHDYIQMLFPLPEGSMFNWEAPLITREVFDAFRSQDLNARKLRARLRKALDRMLEFYGLVLLEDYEPQTDDVKDEAAEDKASETASDSQTAPDSEASADRSNSTGTTTDAVEQHSAQQPPKPPTTMLLSMRIIRAPNNTAQFKNWVMRFNHNHLRITRILRSLHVLGLKQEAEAFLRALKAVQVDEGRISDTSVMYWRRALQNPLWIAPDGDEVEWLKDVDDDYVSAP